MARTKFLTGDATGNMSDDSLTAMLTVGWGEWTAALAYNSGQSISLPML